MQMGHTFTEAMVSTRGGTDVQAHGVSAGNSGVFSGPTTSYLRWVGRRGSGGCTCVHQKATHGWNLW